MSWALHRADVFCHAPTSTWSLPLKRCCGSTRIKSKRRRRAASMRASSSISIQLQPPLLLPTSRTTTRPSSGAACPRPSRTASTRARDALSVSVCVRTVGGWTVAEIMVLCCGPTKAAARIF
eukprot:7382731-Prymnesium_polylepis.2